MFHKLVVLCLFALCCGEDHNRVVFDLPEGSRCSWKRLEGKCTTIDQCPSAKDAIRQKNYPPICSFQGMKPIVCCTNGGTVVVGNHSITYPVKKLGLGSRFNQSSVAKRQCLHYLRSLDYPCSFLSLIPHVVRSISDNNSYGTVKSSALENADSRPQDLIRRLKRRARNQNAKLFDPSKYPPKINAPAISSGMAAYRRQYPHMALLGYGDDIKTAQWLCGGSVISEKFVLTAAHCRASPAVGPIQFVALGILKRSDSPEYWQTHKVSRIITHPEYKPPSKYNDIALLETENTINFDFNVLPACLPMGPESAETAEATGWGALGHRQGLADVLQTVKLQRYEEEKCSELYPKHRHLLEGYNHTTQMCYGDTREAKDTCEGDSGGPLQTANEFLSCAYTVLGVTSYGRQCGISAGSGMYTRVYHYVPWIESIVWPSGGPQG